MKRLFFPLALLLIAGVTFVACGGGGNRSVVINGVHWATHNVDTPGTFTRNSEDFGGLFTWEEAQNACPRGWRLPTADELQSLRDAAGGGWTAVNGVNGHTFGTVPNQIFLPAAGWHDTDGTLNNVGAYGRYWSSTGDLGFAMHLNFDRRGSGVGTRLSAFGFSVRCVAD